MLSILGRTRYRQTLRALIRCRQRFQVWKLKHSCADYMQHVKKLGNQPKLPVAAGCSSSMPLMTAPTRNYVKVCMSYTWSCKLPSMTITHTDRHTCELILAEAWCKHQYTSVPENTHQQMKMELQTRGCIIVYLTASCTSLDSGVVTAFRCTTSS